MKTAPDEEVIASARRDDRVLVSADTDFGAILALSGATRPSFILLRRAANRRPGDQAALIMDNLDAVVADLEAGAIVVLGEATVRIRRLPIGDES